MPSLAGSSCWANETKESHEFRPDPSQDLLEARVHRHISEEIMGTFCPGGATSSGVSAGVGDKEAAVRLLLGRQAEPGSTMVIKVSFFNRGWKQK